MSGDTIPNFLPIPPHTYPTMLNGLPFHAKWRINASGITVFYDGNGNHGTDLIAYDVPVTGWSGIVGLQLACAPAGAATPADLPFMAWNPCGGFFAQLQAIATYPDDYTPLWPMFGGGLGLQLMPIETYMGSLGNYPSLPGFGFYTGESAIPGGTYSIIAVAASAHDLRSGIQGAGADYSWASLNGEDYSNLQMPNANFAFADLTNTKLAGSNLSGAVFTNVLPLTGTTLNGCNLTGANFASVDISNMDFSGANFTNADLRKVTSLKGAKFTGANLSGANFSGLDLTGVDLGGANLQGTLFTGCDLTVATFSTPPVFSTSHLALTGLASAKLNYSLIELEWSYLDLTHATIVGLPTKLDGLSAVWTNLTGQVLKDMSITGANFSNATLQNVVFAQSNLSRSQFISAQLQGDTTIPSATLTSCMLMDVDFTGANLTNVDLSNAYFYGANASLKGATILLSIFAGTYLTGVDFSGVLNSDFQGVTFTNACLVNALFKNCNIDDYLGRPTTFAGACLHGADFTGASVTGCDLYNAGVAATAGTIMLTLPINGVPVPLPTNYQPTLGLTVATNNTTVCPNGQRGPCTAADLIALDPPTKWP